MSAVGFVLTLRSPDVRGLVAAVTTFLADHGCSITEAAQYQDDRGAFFMRIAFVSDAPVAFVADDIRDRLAPLLEPREVDVLLYDINRPPRVLVLVSRFGHCLYDLLHRWRSGHLPVEIVGVASNHDHMRSFVEWSGLPYFHLPIDGDQLERQEREIIGLVDTLQVDLVVLARYMRILSPRLCDLLSGRCINIHHSFLPSFKGARPYHQAHARGVKIIGATAHYVTTDLDEGPIIEQETRRVSHTRTGDQLVELGQEVECGVLSRAVRWHAERRVLVNGQRTVVFD